MFPGFPHTHLCVRSSAHGFTIEPSSQRRNFGKLRLRPTHHKKLSLKQHTIQFYRTENTQTPTRWFCLFRGPGRTYVLDVYCRAGAGLGGSSPEWLLDEPGLDELTGFFILMKRATIIMNLRSKRAGRERCTIQRAPARASVCEHWPGRLTRTASTVCPAASAPLTAPLCRGLAWRHPSTRTYPVSFELSKATLIPVVSHRTRERLSVGGDREVPCCAGGGRAAERVGAVAGSAERENRRGPWVCLVELCCPGLRMVGVRGAGVRCTHHEHKEGSVVRWRAIRCRCDTKCVLFALKALGASAHGVPLQRVQDLLHARSLRPILANAVHCAARTQHREW